MTHSLLDIARSSATTSLVLVDKHKLVKSRSFVKLAPKGRREQILKRECAKLNVSYNSLKNYCRGY